MDPIYYSLFNEDLRHLTDFQLIEHYNIFHKVEKRLVNKYDFYNLHPNFDLNFYRLYNDLINFSEYELISHYYHWGMKENRLTSVNMFLQKYPDFDSTFYREKYDDVKMLSNECIYIHYWMTESKEHRFYSYTDTLIDIKKAKICLIYVYYERKNEQKNQTNLSFFIKYGLDKKNWLNLDITYLFVINGHQIEVIIPNEPNIHILKEDNCMDYEGWYNGIKYFENLYDKKIWEQFDYLCFVNCSITGPFINQDINNHWLIPFYEKMKSTNSIVCCPCINYLPNTDAGGPGPRMQSPFILTKINKKIINLLLNTQITNIDPNSINKCYTILTNTIIGKKYDRVDAILTGEYGFSRILLNNNYNICCLYYDDISNIQYNTISNHNRVDFYSDQNEQLKKTVFIKNIWRSDNSYVCLPVLYEYCINFIYEKTNMKNIYNSIDTINHQLININCMGKNIYNSKYDWNNKIKYYNLYGIPEETIVFPIIEASNKAIAIYFHYDSDNIMKDYVINGIKALIYSGYDIVFCTTSEKINNVDISTLPFNINFLKNYGKGSEFKYWHEILETNLSQYKSKYEWILLLNNSILFPIHGIENFQNTILTMRNNCNFWGHWESNEIKHHSISSLNEFNINIIDDLINFYKIQLNQLTDDSYTKSFFINFENEQTEYLINKGYVYKCVVPINKLLIDPLYICPIFHPNVFIQWINRDEVFAIKWKYMFNYINLELINNPILNYLTRYIHF